MKKISSLHRGLAVCGIAVIFFLTAHLTLTRFYLTPILMYHHVDGRAGEWKLSVSPQSFAAQMEYLYQNDYQVLDLGDYIGRLKKGQKIPGKTVVITFDDGYKNNFTEALPVLKKYGFPSTIFIQVDGIGREGYMTQEEIKTLIKNGIHIGSHTVHHGFLPDLSVEDKRSEIVLSKKTLEEALGIPVPLFSYPGGGFDAVSRQIVVESGYAGAVATHPGRDYPNKDPYALKRIRISRTSDNLLVFWLQLSGFYTYYEELRG